MPLRKSAHDAKTSGVSSTWPQPPQGDHALIVLSALENCLEKSADTMIAFEDCLRKRGFSPSPERGRFRAFALPRSVNGRRPIVLQLESEYHSITLRLISPSSHLLDGLRSDCWP